MIERSHRVHLISKCHVMTIHNSSPTTTSFSHIHPAGHVPRANYLQANLAIYSEYPCFVTSDLLKSTANITLRDKGNPVPV
jgi:hypothetical protein